MRTYGRVQDEFGVKRWITIETDEFGNDDAVWLTTLCQTLRLNLGELPFFANYGIPAHESVVTQIFPDFYVIATQQQYAQYFTSLIVSRDPVPEPTYEVNIVTNAGAKIMETVPG